MKWNYRIAANVDDDCYDVLEVYYNEDGSVAGYVKADVSGWDQVADIKGTLQLMLEACDKPLVELREGKVTE